VSSEAPDEWCLDIAGEEQPGPFELEKRLRRPTGRRAELLKALDATAGQTVYAQMFALEALAEKGVPELVLEARALGHALRWYHGSTLRAPVRRALTRWLCEGGYSHEVLRALAKDQKGRLAKSGQPSLAGWLSIVRDFCLHNTAAYDRVRQLDALLGHVPNLWVIEFLQTLGPRAAVQIPRGPLADLAAIRPDHRGEADVLAHMLTRGAPASIVHHAAAKIALTECGWHFLSAGVRAARRQWLVALGFGEPYIDLMVQGALRRERATAAAVAASAPGGAP
jgi:hypothetical protein